MVTTLVRCACALLASTLLVLSRPSPATAWQAAGSPLAFDPASCNAIPPSEFDKEGRLAAMLSVHAYAYLDANAPGVLTTAFKNPPLVIDKAALFLRCDKDPLSISRRRRAIAKLAAYGWPGRFTQELLVLGLKVDLFKTAVSETISPSVLNSALLNRALLEFLFARLLHQRPVLIADSDGDECDDQPESPYDPPFDDDTVSQISIETYVSVKPPKESVYKNVDPQRWDECSKFWPAPDASMTPPLDQLGSTYLATAKSPDCALTLDEIYPVTPAPPAGEELKPSYFFERFVCKKPPCDATFENLLSITVEEKVHDVYMVGKFWTHRVDYGFPRCTTNGGFDPFDGGISTKMDAQSPSPKVVLDEGTMDVWDQTDGKGVKRTHVRGHKKVKFDNPVQNGSAGVALGFAELNEELAEVACCLKKAGVP